MCSKTNTILFGFMQGDAGPSLGREINPTFGWDYAVSTTFHFRTNSQ